MTPSARTRPSTRWRTGTLVTFALLALGATAFLVIWRRGRGIDETKAIAAREVERRELSAQIAQLEAELAEAMSWSRIRPAAERRLGLREASDAQLVTLVRSAPDAMGAASPDDRSPLGPSGSGEPPVP